MQDFVQFRGDKLKKQIRFVLTLGLCLMGAAHPVFGHIVLTEPKAVAGSYYKATLRVGHGCSGFATTSLTVQVPAGFQGAKPQPKAGWNIAIRKAKLVKPYNSHGKTVTDDVVELRWTAVSKEANLPDEQFDEFAFISRLPETVGPAWVKVIQTCESGQTDWSEIPASGSSTRGLKTPAAMLDIQAAPKHEHHH
jgi:uncharacterized protein YcnI